jgi:CheY-like chemotaxis protein
MAATDSKKQILIVDQDVAAVEPLRQRLCDANRARIADGAAAVTALAERPPHLVIIDWNAPGFAALEVMAVARVCAVLRSHLQGGHPVRRSRRGRRGLRPGSHFYCFTRCSTPKFLFCK